MPAELGQTTDPKALIPGDPNAITADLRKLVGNVKVANGVAEGLSGVNPGQWSGAASDAFHHAMSKEPPKWTDAVSQMGKGGNGLADYGNTLTWAQGEAQRAIELYTQAQAATRAAKADHDQNATQAASAGQPPPPFNDPGAKAIADAQKILDHARGEVKAAGGTVLGVLGFKKGDDGKYTKEIGDGKEFGAKHRKKTIVRDPKTGKPVIDPKTGKPKEVDPGGWQSNKGGKSYKKTAGTELSDGMMGDKVKDVLKAAGVNIHEHSGKTEASAAVLDGKVDGQYKDGDFTAQGKAQGSVLSADANASGSVSVMGAEGQAHAGAYLAKGSAEGSLKYGHLGADGKAEAYAGAEANASGSVGVTGARGHVDAFAGAKASASGSVEAGGVGAGGTAEAWAGAGAEADGQIGMGDDGKFHLGASVGVGLGIGGKVGFDVSVDPGEVVDTVKDVGDDIGNAADSVGDAIGSIF